MTRWDKEAVISLTGGILIELSRSFSAFFSHLLLLSTDFVDSNRCLVDLKNFIRCPCVTLRLLAEILFVVSRWSLSNVFGGSQSFDPPEHNETCMQLLRVEILYWSLIIIFADILYTVFLHL